MVTEAAKLAHDFILLPANTKFPEVLSNLGIRTIQVSGQNVLTERECDKAGVPFEFFKAFAKLTSRRTLGKGSTATHLLDPVQKQLPMEMDPMEMDSSDFFIKSLLGLNETIITPEDQSHYDRLLDWGEAVALLSALYLLATPNSNEKGLDLQLAKARIMKLSENPCWLTPTALRLGVLGTLNHANDHFMGAKRGILLTQRETTAAEKFQCPYIPEMTDLEVGLFFKPQQMPPAITAAARSVVMVEIDNGRGSGVVIEGSSYILTARHVLGTINRSGEKKTVTISGDGFKLRSAAEVVTIDVTHGDALPDLALLYVPDMPKKVKPVHEDSSKGIGRKRSEVFLIGAPHQFEPIEQLVSVGQIDPVATQGDTQGLVHSTAIALPGVSGGAAVNKDGEFLGIVVEMTTDDMHPKEIVHHGDSRQLLLTANVKYQIKGSRFYPIDTWGASIRNTIRAHQKIKR